MLLNNGNTDNHIMWRGGLNIIELFFGAGPEAAAMAAAIDSNSWNFFIQWVDAIASDTRKRQSKAIKTIRNKPADLVDGCWTKELQPQFIAEEQTWSREPDTECNTRWASWSFPREVAGGPLHANNLKCKLKSVDFGDYNVTMSMEQQTQLSNIFSDGVCDWSKPGTGQVRVVPWASVGPSPINQIYDITRH